MDRLRGTACELLDMSLVKEEKRQLADYEPAFHNSCQVGQPTLW